MISKLLVAAAALLPSQERRNVASHINAISGPGSTVLLPNIDGFFPEGLDFVKEADLAKSLLIFLAVALDESRSNPSLMEKFTAIVGPSTTGGFVGEPFREDYLRSEEVGELFGDILTDERLISVAGTSAEKDFLESKLREYQSKLGYNRLDSNRPIPVISTDSDRLAKLAVAVTGDPSSAFATPDHMISMIGDAMSTMAQSLNQNFEGDPAFSGAPKTKAGQIVNNVLKAFGSGVASEINSRYVTPNLIAQPQNGSQIGSQTLTANADQTLRMSSSLVEGHLGEMILRLNNMRSSMEDQRKEYDAQMKDMGRIQVALSALRASDLMAEAMYHYPIVFDNPEKMAESIRPILEAGSTSMWSKIRGAFGGDVFDGFEGDTGDIQSFFFDGDPSPLEGDSGKGIINEYLGTVGQTASSAIETGLKAAKEIWSGMSPTSKVVAGTVAAGAGALALSPVLRSAAMMSMGMGGFGSPGQMQSYGMQASGPMIAATGGKGSSSMKGFLAGPGFGPTPELLRRLAEIGTHIRVNGQFRAFDRIRTLSGDVHDSYVPVMHIAFNGDVLPMPYGNVDFDENLAFQGGFFKKIGSKMPILGKVAGAVGKMANSPIGRIVGKALKIVPGVGNALGAISMAAGVAGGAKTLLTGKNAQGKEATLGDRIEASMMMNPLTSGFVETKNFLQDQNVIPRDLLGENTPEPPRQDQYIQKPTTQKEVAMAMWGLDAPGPFVGDASLSAAFFGDVAGGRVSVGSMGAKLLQTMSDGGKKAMESLATYITSVAAPKSKSWLSTFWSWIKTGASAFSGAKTGTKVIVALGLAAACKMVYNRLTSNTDDAAVAKNVMGDDYQSMITLMEKQNAGTITEAEMVELGVVSSRLQNHAPDLFKEAKNEVAKAQADAMTAPSATTPSEGSSEFNFADLSLDNVMAKMKPFLPFLAGALGAGGLAWLVARLTKRQHNQPEAVIPVAFGGDPSSWLAQFDGHALSEPIGDVSEALAANLAPIFRTKYAPNFTGDVSNTSSGFFF